MIWNIAFVLILLADQGVKWLIRANIEIGESIQLIPGLLALTHVENAGAAFGMMQGRNIFLIVLPAAVVAVAVFYFTRKETPPLMKTSLMMVASGGMANLIDRVVSGTVTDMIEVSFFPPVFNVADISVTLGCALLMIYVLKNGFDDGSKDERKDA